MWPWWKSWRQEFFFTADLALTLSVSLTDCWCLLFFLFFFLYYSCRCFYLYSSSSPGCSWSSIWKWLIAVLFKFIFCGFICLFTAEKSSAARAEFSLVFRSDLQEVEATCSREQRSFSFIHLHHCPRTLFALIYCPLTKTCDYTPFFLSSSPLQKAFVSYMLQKP